MYDGAQDGGQRDPTRAMEHYVKGGRGNIYKDGTTNKPSGGYQFNSTKGSWKC